MEILKWVVIGLAILFNFGMSIWWFFNQKFHSNQQIVHMGFFVLLTLMAFIDLQFNY